MQSSIMCNNSTSLKFFLVFFSSSSSFSSAHSFILICNAFSGYCIIISTKYSLKFSFSAPYNIIALYSFLLRSLMVFVLYHVWDLNAHSNSGYLTVLTTCHLGNPHKPIYCSLVSIRSISPCVYL